MSSKDVDDLKRIFWRGVRDGIFIFVIAFDFSRAHKLLAEGQLGISVLIFAISCLLGAVFVPFFRK